VVSNQHRLSRRRALDVEDLADEPLLLLHRSFGSRQWFDTACSIAHIRPRLLLESAAPQTLVALTEAGYGVAVVPSTVRLPNGVRALPLIQRKASIGRWLAVAWDPRRLLAAYAERFVEELVAHCKRSYPGRELGRRAPPLPQPRSQ
jgi:DNA-binding transcriptional LysR family regulator